MLDPAIPIHVRAISCWLTFADLQASAIAASSALPAASTPTFLILMVLPTLFPRTRSSSPITHSVLVPPPSIPRKKLTYLVLPRALSRFPTRGNQRLVTTKALPSAVQDRC